MIPHINPDYCKGCMICVYMCPKKVYEKGDTVSQKGYVIPVVAHPDACFNADKKEGEKPRCTICYLMCPDHAITYVSSEVQNDASETR